jgi:hypothetical protein
MGRRSVFISYRRQLSWQLARLVYDNLERHRFDTFMDVENLDSGEFPTRILSQIEAREHFIVLLQPGSLDHIGEDGDWLRREIAHALARGRNVVPVTADGFELGRDPTLPSDVAKLTEFNAVAIRPDYFDAAMEKLRTRFLKKPPRPIAPPPAGTLYIDRLPRRPAEKPKSAAAPVLPPPELTWLRGPPDRVCLGWSEVPGASEYVLERAPDPEVVSLRPVHSGWREVYRGPHRSYDDVPSGEGPELRVRPALSPATVQWWLYRVRAGASGQAGMWSNTLRS